MFEPQAYISSQNTETLGQIIKDWEQFEKEGNIGDCELRRTAQFIMGKLASSNITFWMKDVAFMTYREMLKRTSRELSDAGWRINYDRQGGV